MLWGRDGILRFVRSIAVGLTMSKIFVVENAARAIGISSECYTPHCISWVSTKCSSRAVPCFRSELVAVQMNGRLGIQQKNEAGTWP